MTTRGLEAFRNADLEEFGENPSWLYPFLRNRHQDFAEDRLSSILLQIAVSNRTLDDQLDDNTKLEAFDKGQLQDIRSDAESCRLLLM
ncbi:hypothetical protein [Primorskyibacter flagellatus]|uniref:hypothetical protein n=1 Tax=Primorskyibacter flagellatus TaxID=1387277 RepID=UPI003A8F0C2F